MTFFDNFFFKSSGEDESDNSIGPLAASLEVNGASMSGLCLESVDADVASRA
jgi:hypothetical protein